MLLIYSKQKTTGSRLDSVLNKNDNIQFLRIRYCFEEICLIFTKTNAPTLFLKILLQLNIKSYKFAQKFFC
jgi:hypothetical protein